MLNAWTGLLQFICLKVELELKLSGTRTASSVPFHVGSRSIQQQQQQKPELVYTTEMLTSSRKQQAEAEEEESTMK